ncbi:DinB family protein [Deinococcus detaillensis]|uniref:DinB family protein n=1 Tax=Deinococcus detaillensis TaxID=2592048 RepID=UPI001CDD6045|nr:DinB family protein [Deinococcus detaillensis]
MTQTDYASRMDWLLAFGKTPDEVAGRLERELSTYQQTVARAQAHWNAVLPERDWSPAQETEHVILVNEGSAKIAALLLSDKQLRPTEQTPIEVDAQGRRQAPSNTLPSAGQPWEHLDARFGQAGQMLQTLALRADDNTERRFFHAAMGEITALDWLRMAAFHTRHHRKKLEAGLTQLEALGGPAVSAPTPAEPQGKLEKGVRGFELDAHVTFSGPHTAEEVTRLLRGFGARVEAYGTQDVRVARVTGQVDTQLAREQLRALLESGAASRVEVGLHGFMRSSTGQTDWVPWRRNVVLGRSDWEQIKFEEGLRYVIE